MQAPSDRFTTVVTDEEISNLVNEKMNANTKKNTKWAVGVFNQWRSFQAQNGDPIIELHMMNAECMNYWLERFVMETSIRLNLYTTLCVVSLDIVGT